MFAKIPRAQISKLKDALQSLQVVHNLVSVLRRYSLVEIGRAFFTFQCSARSSEMVLVSSFFAVAVTATNITE